MASTAVRRERPYPTISFFLYYYNNFVCSEGAQRDFFSEGRLSAAQRSFRRIGTQSLLVGTQVRRNAGTQERRYAGTQVRRNAERRTQNAPPFGPSEDKLFGSSEGPKGFFFRQQHRIGSSQIIWQLLFFLLLFFFYGAKFFSSEPLPPLPTPI